MGTESLNRLRTRRFVLPEFPAIIALALLCSPGLRAQPPFPDRQPVQSSDLSSVGYDARRRMLDIEFRSGGIYRYHDVPGEIFERLLASESKGRFFASHIRARFRFERIRPRASAAK